MLSRRLVGYCLIDDDNISDLFYLAKYQRQIAPSGRKSISEDTSIFHSLAPPGSRNCHGRRRRRQHIAPSVKVISVVSKEHLRIGLTQNFFDSVVSAGGLPEFVLVKKSDRGTFWKTRVQGYIDYLATLENDEIAVLSDVDVIATRPLSLLWKTLVNEYGFGLESAILIGSEELCDTDSCARQTQLQATRRRSEYLNAGIMVGKVKALSIVLRAALKDMAQSIGLDDQGALDKLYKSRELRVKIFLDSNRILVKNFSPYSSFDGNMNTSFFYHFPGMNHNSNELQNLCQRSLMNQYNLLLNSMQAAKRSSKSNVYVSLTTTPGRLANLLPTLNSLLQQTLVPDKIILNIPKVFKKTGQLYLVPSELHKFPRLLLNSCVDYGPATKLLPTLQLLNDPTTIIVTVDDEYIYPDSMIETLVKSAQHDPDAAFSYAGQNVEFDFASQHGVAVRSADTPGWNRVSAAVDIIEGFLGAAYRREFFDESIFRIIPRCYSTDDIWFSAHLSRKHISRVKIPMPFARPLDDITGNDSVLNLRGQNVHNARKNDLCARELVKDFQKSWDIKSPSLCSVPGYSLLQFSPWSDKILDFLDPLWNPEENASPCTKRFHYMGSHLREGQVWRVNQGLIDEETQFAVVLNEHGQLCMTSSDSWRQMGELQRKLVCHKFKPEIPKNAALGNLELSHAIVQDGIFEWYARASPLGLIRSLDAFMAANRTVGEILVAKKKFCSVDRKSRAVDGPKVAVALSRFQSHSGRLALKAVLLCGMSNLTLISM